MVVITLPVEANLLLQGSDYPSNCRELLSYVSGVSIAWYRLCMKLKRYCYCVVAESHLVEAISLLCYVGISFDERGVAVVK